MTHHALHSEKEQLPVVRGRGRNVVMELFDRAALLTGVVRVLSKLGSLPSFESTLTTDGHG